MLTVLATTQLSDLRLRQPVLAQQSDSLSVVTQRMRDAGRGSTLILTDDGRLAGIFTQRDLIKRVDLCSKGWGDLPVCEVMTKKPVVLGIGASLGDALERMDAHSVRSLPVLDDEQRPVGLVSVRDALRHIAEHFPQDFINLPPEPSLEATGLYGG